jgi:hypothetical protein
MKRLFYLGLCFMLSLVLVLGSVSSLSSPSLVFPAPLLKNAAFAINMKDAPATTEAITDAPPGDDEADNNEDDDENGEDTQVTTRTITVEEDEDNDDNKEDHKKEQGTSDPKATKVPDCPEGQEHGLFTTCMPIQSCANQLELGAVAINPPNTNNCVNAPVVDHPSSQD